MIRARSSLTLALLFSLAAPGGASAAPPTAPGKAPSNVAQAAPAPGKPAPAAPAPPAASALPKDIEEQERLAEETLHKGDWKGALKLAGTTITTIERRLGRDHAEIAFMLLFTFEIKIRVNQLASAEPELKRAIAILERDPAKYASDLHRAMTGLAIVLEEIRGDVKGAIALRLRAIEILEKARGANDPDVVRGLRSLARLYTRARQGAAARPILARILALFETIPDMPPEEIATLLFDIAVIDVELGAYDSAESGFRRALDIRRAIPGVKPILLAALSNNLAEIALIRGDYPTAERLFEEALAIHEKEAAPDSADIGTIVGNLGCIALERGDIDRAIELLKRSLALREKALGPDSVDLAGARANLAEALMRSGDVAAAAPLIERALEARQKAFPPDHPLVARSLHDLATLRSSIGQEKEAIVLFERVIRQREAALGPDHPEVAESLYNLAVVFSSIGEYKAAAPLFERALAIREKALGPRSPGLAQVLHAQAVLHIKMGQDDVAQRELARAADIAERHAGLVLSVGSERERVAYLATITPLLRTTVGASLTSKDPGAKELALTFVLRQKGRALDAVADSMLTLRKRLSPEDQASLDALREAQRKLAALALQHKSGDAAGRAEVEAQQATVDRLESEISKRSASFRVLGEPVKVSDVRAALPEGSALVEIIESAPFPPSAAGSDPSHYVAYVTGREGAIEVRDLGEATPIDEAAQELRKALMNPASNTADLARKLGDKVMGPLRGALGAARSVFLSPDGQLNLVPFEALVGADGRPLVEQYTFTYLTSGRDLLRRSLRRPSRSGPVVLANPDFGGAPAALSASPAASSASPAASQAPASSASQAPAPASRGARIGDLGRVRFPPLPGTAEEGKAIGAELRGAALHEGMDARKSVVAELKGPRILHIATHGFFLGTTDRGGSGTSRGFVLEGGPTPSLEGPSQNPLLRSGIALVGANQQGEAKASGILTALEASGLDLDGTKLVALSACETGVGEVHAGEGVYGLRRSLVIAGAESVVMSLWKVDDEATRDLMVDYYRRLEAGEGRSEALRAVRLRMMAEPGREHPYYWASFIVSGDPSSLVGVSVPSAGVVHPSARGCACRIGEIDGEGGTGELPWISIGVFGAAWAAARGRRRARR